MFLPSDTRSARVAFGPFTFDPESNELRRGNRLVSLRPKATQVLAALVEARGRLVTRQSLVDRAWPNTILEAEPALHTAIRQIRRALDDSAQKPRYVETVHRRGYRFAARISEAAPTTGRSHVLAWAASTSAGALLVVALAAVLLAGSGVPGDPPELNRAAYLVARGSDEDVTRAVSVLEPLAAGGSRSAGVWSTLAAAYVRLHRFDDADRTARRALDIEDSSAEAYRVLAEVAMHRDQDWTGAEQRFLEALRLDPNHALAHNGYAYLLALTGSPEESVREARRAIALEPLSALINGDAAVLLYWAGRYEEAAHQATRTLEIEPDYLPALKYLRLALMERGDIDGARAAAVRLLRTVGASEATIAQADGETASLGLRVFREWAVERTGARVSDADPDTWVRHGLALAELGRLEQAQAAVDRARELGAGMWPVVAVDPRGKSLR